MKSRFGIYTDELWQYISIYILYLLNDSNLYKIVLMKYNIIMLGVFGAFVFLIFLHGYSLAEYSGSFLAFSLICVVLTRLRVGGVGLYAWLQWAVPITVTFYACQFDPEKFLERWVRFVVLMAVISLVFYLAVQINAGMVRKILPTRFVSEHIVTVWGDQAPLVTRAGYGNGLLLYSVRAQELDRNNGLFGEPGLYQMVLNSALYILLFLRDRLDIDDGKRARYIFILLATLVTCKSTSGYISALALIFVYVLLNNRNEENVIRRRIMGLSSIVVVIGLADYLIRGRSSLIYEQIIAKLFSNGQFDLAADTGSWRLMTMATEGISMLKHPLGIGYDAANGQLIQGSTGAQLFITGAALGIIPFIAFQVWTCYPILKTRELGRLEKIGFLFMYYNSMLTQSKDFYPAFVLFTIAFSISMSDEHHWT